MIYEGYTPDHFVMVDTDDSSLLVSLRVNPDVVIASLTFGTLAMLSENLRDIVGYGPASDLLQEWNIPSESTLWSLGRKG